MTFLAYPSPIPHAPHLDGLFPVPAPEPYKSSSVGLKPVQSLCALTEVSFRLLHSVK